MMFGRKLSQESTKMPLGKIDMLGLIILTGNESP